ncbi:hypothetical protein C8R46DRAFT_1038036 [Mycena filopes]|nr:hypothetical protein C8R46DRAFT_1038036 [Mycena filopes]
MSSTLADWTAAQLTALYAPPDNGTDEKATADAAFASTFAPDAEIFLNHARVGAAELRAFVEARRAGAAFECKSEDLVQGPVATGEEEAEADADAGTTIVAGTATLVRTHKFRIRAAPAQTRTVIVFSARIKETPTRQIVQLFHTAVDKPFKVNLHPALHAPATVDASAL